MKVLFINNDKGWGGGQEFLLELAGELINHGFNIHFVVRGGSPSERRFGELGFTTHPASHDLETFFTLAAIMRRERFDVISINREHDIPLTVISRYMAFPFSPPGKMIMNYHIPVARRQPFLGAMDAFVCVSDHIRSTLLQLYPAKAKYTQVISNGIKAAFPIPEEKFTHSRSRRYFRDLHFPLIGMVGAFWKNQTELVECIPALRDQFPDIRVVFVGDITELPLVTPVLDKIRELGVEKHVIFTGKVPRDRISDIFFDLDVSVSTHRNEGFGIVHLESLAAGTPVVCYDEGGVRDIFSGAEVAFAVRGGIAEFSAAVIALLGDEELRYNMGRRGNALVQTKYTSKAMAKNYVNFWESLVGRSIN